MAKINAVNTLISAGVGLIDLGIEKGVDPRVGKIAGVTPSFIAKTAMCLGSAAVNLVGYETAKSEIIFYSSLPLFEKALVDMFTGAVASPTYRPVAAPAPAPTKPASKAPAKAELK